MDTMIATLGQMMSPPQMLAVYEEQVARLHRRLCDAAVATNFGAGGEQGRRYLGMFYHQHVGQYEAAVASRDAIKVEVANA